MPRRSGNRARIYGLNTHRPDAARLHPRGRRQAEARVPVSAASRLNTTRALSKIEQDATLACPEVQYLVDFIRTSQRGPLLRRPTRRTEEMVADE